MSFSLYEIVYHSRRINKLISIDISKSALLFLSLLCYPLRNVCATNNETNVTLQDFNLQHVFIIDYDKILFPKCLSNFYFITFYFDHKNHVSIYIYICLQIIFFNNVYNIITFPA